MIDIERLELVLKGMVNHTKRGRYDFTGIAEHAVRDGEYIRAVMDGVTIYLHGDTYMVVRVDGEGHEWQ
jgi:hypothetical protein